MAVVRTVIYTFLFSALIMGTFAAMAGNRVDSLQKLLATHQQDDTTKVKLYLTLANQYEQMSGDSVMKYSTLAHKLAHKIDYEAGIADGLEMIGAAQHIYGKYDTALEFYQRSIIYCKEHGLQKLLASKYSHIGNIKFLTNRFTDARAYYDSAITFATQYNYPELKGKATSNLASVYYKMGNYTRALNLYLEGLKIQERMGNPVTIASDLANIANVYYRLGVYDKAIEYNNRVLEINRKQGIKERIIGTYTTFAMIYSDKKMYDSSEVYLNKALQLAIEMQSPYLQNIVMGNLGECHLKKGNLGKSLELYTQSLEMSKKLGDSEGLAIAKSGLGQVLLAQGQTNTGRQHLEDAFAMMLGLGIKEQALDIASRLSASYASSGLHKQAYYFLSEKMALSDSIAIQKAKQDIEYALFDYELQKKEQQIKLLEADNALQLQNNQHQRMLIWFAMCGALLIAIVAYIIYRNAQAVKRSRQVIIQQKEELTQQAARLAELNDFKDATFSLLAHDLRSPVNALAGTMLMLEEKMIAPEEFATYQAELNNKLQAVTILIDNMLYWAQNQMKGESVLNIEKVSIKRKVVRALSVLQSAASQKSIDLIDNVDGSIHAMADKDHMDIVIRNLVSNAIKFTHFGGSITIIAERQGDKTAVVISDTGIGMTGEQLSQLHTEKTQISTKGTEGEKGTGLGLRLCYQLVQKNNGELLVDSIPGKGTTFTILLPSA